MTIDISTIPVMSEHGIVREAAHDARERAT